MNNKSGNDIIGTVFIQDNLVHPDAQRITVLSLFGAVFVVMRLGTKKYLSLIFSNQGQAKSF